MMRILLCLMMALTSMPPASRAQTPRDAVTGVVLDPSGAAVADAVVILEMDGGRRITTRTSAEGRFELADVPDPPRTLRVTSPGFAETAVPVADASVAGEPIQIVLQPAALFETVTVTASRSDERLSTPAATTVITAHELANQAAGPIDDVLRNTPGFGLTRRSSSRVANPSTQGVSIRGLAGNAGSRTLVLADGLPLNDQFGGWVYWNRVPEAAVDRIEVVRGAAGDLYGGDAVSGVIQLLTFTPSRSMVNATVDGGTANTWRGSLFAGGQRAGWTGTAAGEWVNTDGEPVVAAAERGPVDVPAYSNYVTGLATLGYDTGRWRANGKLWTYQEVRGNGTPLVTNDTNWRLFSGNSSGSIGTGLWSVQASGGWQHYFNNFSSVPVDRKSERVTNSQRVPSNFAGAVAQWVQPWRAHTFLFGVEAKRTDATVYDTRYSLTGVPADPVVTGGIENAQSVYGRAAFHPGDTVTIVAGARGDFWNSNPQEADAPLHAVNFFSPRASVLWQTTASVALRASATHAYRTPTLDELHRSSRIGNTLTYGNPLLDPEDLTAFELGATYTHARRSVRATWFWNDLTNAITNITLSTTPSQITKQKQNADNVRAYGLELEGEFRPWRPLSLTAGAVFTSSHFRNEVKLPALEGNQVPQIPSFQFNGSATWTDARLLTLALQVRGSNLQFEDDLNTLPLDGYTVADVYVSRAITGTVQAFAACENVFDTEYQTGKTGNPPVTKVGWPRTFRVGVRIALR